MVVLPWMEWLASIKLQLGMDWNGVLPYPGWSGIEWYGIRTGRLVGMEWLCYPGWNGMVWYGSLVWNGVLPMVNYHTLAGTVWSGMEAWSGRVCFEW